MRAGAWQGRGGDRGLTLDIPQSGISDEENNRQQEIKQLRLRDKTEPGAAGELRPSVRKKTLPHRYFHVFSADEGKKKLTVQTQHNEKQSVINAETEPD